MTLSMSKIEREAFLADVHIGVLAVARPDDVPSLTPVWYRYHDGVVQIATTAASAKVKLAREAGRASLCAQREEGAPAYVTVEGSVEIGPLPEEVLPDIAARYLDPDGVAGFLEVTEDDTLLTLHVDRWRTADFGKAMG